MEIATPWHDFTSIKAKPFSPRTDSRFRAVAPPPLLMKRCRWPRNSGQGSEVVIKIQAWTTGRAGIGGVAFAKKPDDVRGHAARMLAMKVGQFPVEAVLVEEKIAIEREFFLSFAIDDAARAPMIIFAAGGGTGIEERAASTRRIACDVKRGPIDSAVTEAAASMRTFEGASGATRRFDSEIICRRAQRGSAIAGNQSAGPDQRWSICCR